MKYNLPTFLKKLYFRGLASLDNLTHLRRFVIGWKGISDNHIKRVKRDMYAVVDPTTGSIYAVKYLIDCASAPAAYLIYHFALEYHGLSNQAYHTLAVAAEQRFQNFEYGGIDYVYAHSPLDK